MCTSKNPSNGGFLAIPVLRCCLHLTVRAKLLQHTASQHTACKKRDRKFWVSFCSLHLSLSSSLPILPRLSTASMKSFVEMYPSLLLSAYLKMQLMKALVEKSEISSKSARLIRSDLPVWVFILQEISSMLTISDTRNRLGPEADYFVQRVWL